MTPIHRTIIHALLGGAAALAGACGGTTPDPDPDSRADDRPPAGTDPTHLHVHHDHDHADPTDASPATLGTVEVAGIALTARGDAMPVAGDEAHLQITLDPPDADVVAIRAWIGIESGRGSRAVLGDHEAEHPEAYHFHLPVPDPLPENAAVWVEVEHQSGERSRVAIELH